MRVVLDSSAIISSSLTFDSPVMRSISAAAIHLGLVICVPEVVIEEVSNHYREELEKQSKAFNDSLSRLQSLSAAKAGNEITPEQIAELLVAHRRKVEGWITGAGGCIVDYPKATHRDIASLAVSKAKPFYKDGSGYRDALIWFTVVELLESDPAPLVFVSSNTRDFAEDGKSESLTLHPDLLGHLVRAGRTKHDVSYLRTINDLHTLKILPSLQELKDVSAQLETGTFANFDLVEALNKRLNDLLLGIDTELDPGSLGLEFEVSSAEFVEMDGDVVVEGVVARRISDSELLIGVDAIANCTFEVIYRSSFSDHFEHLGSRHPSKEISIGLHLTLSTNNWTVTSMKIDSLGHERLGTDITFDGRDWLRLEDILLGKVPRDNKALRKHFGFLWNS